MDEFIRQYEGKLFLSRFISAFASEHFILDEHYYTLIDGIVYEIHKGKLYASGDKPHDLCTCIEIGLFDKNNLPEHIEPRSFSYNDLVKCGLAGKGGD